METEKFEDVDSTITEKKLEIADVGENKVVEEEEDVEWDEKSWDDVDLKLPSRIFFEDEKVDSELHPITKKEIKVPSEVDHGATSDPTYYC